MPRGRSKKKHASSDEDAESDADVQIMNDGAGAAAAAAAGGSSSSSRHSAALAKHMASLTRVTPVCINRDDDGDGSDAQQAAAAAAAADEEEEKDAQAKNKKGKKLKGDKKDAVMKDEEGKDVAAASTAAAAASSAGAAAAPATRPSSEPSLYVPPEIAGLLKPHQIAGLRFIWRNMVSSAGSLEAARAQKASEGRGCLLAHFCGLGKTVTTISFLYVYLRSGVGRRALIVAPVNTLANWIAEFDKWLRPKHRLDVWALDSCQAHGGRTVQEVRYRCIKEWAKSEGGVLIAGYEGFRHICAAGAGKSGNGAAKKGKQTHKQQEKAKKGPRGISAKHAAAVRQMLLESADVVVADEAHRIKNSKSALAQAMASLVTRRRLTLTGTPLQNNTRELFAMIEFTRPGYLGSEAEFVARFDGPIRAGQCLDSTPDEVERMKKRIHVLHKKLAPLVHRVDYATLQSGGKDSYGISIAQKDNSDEHPPPPQDPTSIRHISVLPRKTEYVCFVRLSPLQRALYKRFISTHKLSMLKAYAALMKIGNHPSCLESTTAVLDADIDASSADEDYDNNDEDESSDSNGVRRRKKKKQKKSNSEAAGAKAAAAAADDSDGAPWYGDLLSASSGYRPGRVEDSGKLLLCVFLLASAFRVREKVLIFSQSLDMLDLLENVLQSFFGLRSDKGYHRLDGSTSASDRHESIQSFNDESSPARVFLISTKAGCLGVNLVGASRVIIFDASWNPANDLQAIYRSYRFGQTRSCLIYRLISHGTMEEKIYRRQLMKNGLSLRLIDHHEVDRHFTMDSVAKLWTLEEGDEDAQEQAAALALSQVQENQPKLIIRKNDDGNVLLELDSDEDEGEATAKRDVAAAAAPAAAAASANSNNLSKQETSAAASSQLMVLDPAHPITDAVLCHVLSLLGPKRLRAHFAQLVVQHQKQQQLARQLRAAQKQQQQQDKQTAAKPKAKMQNLLQPAIKDDDEPMPSATAEPSSKKQPLQSRKGAKATSMSKKEQSEADEPEDEETERKHASSEPEADAKDEGEEEEDEEEAPVRRRLRRGRDASAPPAAASRSKMTPGAKADGSAKAEGAAAKSESKHAGAKDEAKAGAASDDGDSSVQEVAAPPVKRPRGRPRKNPLPAAASSKQTPAAARAIPTRNSRSSAAAAAAVPASATPAAAAASTPMELDSETSDEREPEQEEQEEEEEAPPKLASKRKQSRAKDEEEEPAAASSSEAESVPATKRKGKAQPSKSKGKLVRPAPRGGRKAGRRKSSSSSSDSEFSEEGSSSESAEEDEEDEEDNAASDSDSDDDDSSASSESDAPTSSEESAFEESDEDDSDVIGDTSSESDSDDSDFGGGGGGRGRKRKRKASKRRRGKHKKHRGTKKPHFLRDLDLPIDTPVAEELRVYIDKLLALVSEDGDASVDDEDPEHVPAADAAAVAAEVHLSISDRSWIACIQQPDVLLVNLPDLKLTAAQQAQAEIEFEQEAAPAPVVAPPLRGNAWDGGYGDEAYYARRRAQLSQMQLMQSQALAAQMAHQQMMLQRLVFRPALAADMDDGQFAELQSHYLSQLSVGHSDFLARVMSDMVAGDFASQAHLQQHFEQYVANAVIAQQQQALERIEQMNKARATSAAKSGAGAAAAAASPAAASAVPLRRRHKQAQPVRGRGSSLAHAIDIDASDNDNGDAEEHKARPSSPPPPASKRAAPAAAAAAAASSPPHASRSATNQSKRAAAPPEATNVAAAPIDIDDEDDDDGGPPPPLVPL